MENKEFNEVKTFKSFRNALLNAMKAEIAQLSNEQKEQKKTRKLKNRPSGKSLQSIVDEINSRAYKISNLLFYYRWVKHGLKYWANRNVHSWKEYFCPKYALENWDVSTFYDGKYITIGEKNFIEVSKEFNKICNRYNLSDFQVKYIIDNI